MENKSNKGLIIVLVVLLLIALGVGGFFAYKYYTNRSSSEQNQTNNNSIKDINEITLSEEDKDFFNSLISLSYFANEYNKEYFNDFDFKYEFVLYQALSDLKWDEFTINGDEVTGASRFNYNEFKNYYKKMINEEFDLNVLSNNNLKPEVKDNYIYTTHYTGGPARTRHFEVKKAMYDERNKEYIIEYDYFNLGDYNEATETFEREVLGKGNLKYTKDNNSKVFKSFIITK